LSLVAAVAKLHGLSLTIDSSYPGSCVTLERDQPALLPAGAGLDRVEHAEVAAAAPAGESDRTPITLSSSEA